MTSKTKPMSTHNLTHPLIPRQSALKGRVPWRAECPEGQSAPKRRVPQSTVCPKGQSPPKGRAPCREECPEGQSAQSLKSWNSLRRQQWQLRNLEMKSCSSYATRLKKCFEGRINCKYAQRHLQSRFSYLIFCPVSKPYFFDAKNNSI